MSKCDPLGFCRVQTYSFLHYFLVGDNVKSKLIKVAHSYYSTIFVG
jgi:hypothetical protein